MQTNYATLKAETVALPPIKHRARRPSTRITLAHRLNELKVGESYFVETAKPASFRAQLYNVVNKKRVSGKFKTVTIPAGVDPIYPKKSGLRVQRTAPPLKQKRGLRLVPAASRIAAE